MAAYLMALARWAEAQETLVEERAKFEKRYRAEALAEVGE
jgi:hypothetical protein